MSAKIIQSNFNLETELIIACSQTVLNSSQIAHIANLLSQQLDWSYIYRIIKRNAVFPLVSWNLLQNFKHLLQPETQELLNEEFARHTQNNMLLTGKLIEIVNLLKSKDIPSLPFKGPLLAIQAYGNLSLRQFGDLDVLIPIERVDAAIKLLIAEGYEPINLQRLDNMEQKKDVGFVSKDKNVNLELHWKLSGGHFSLPLEMNRLWKQLETVNLAGMEVGAFPFNTLLIYLCLHGARHCWERFGWICDINELIRSQDNVEWEQLTEEAKRLGCENALALGLFLVHDFFGSATPLLESKKNKNNRAFRKIATQLRVGLFANEWTPLQIGDRYLYHLESKERLSDKWKVHLYYSVWYLKIIFSPNEVDKSLFNLPSWLSPLHYVLRPPRLIYSYLTKSKKD